MPRCRICNRHIEETSDQTRAETGIMWKDTKGGVHCLTSDNEYLTMEDSPRHDLATLGEKEGTMPGDFWEWLEALIHLAAIGAFIGYAPAWWKELRPYRLRTHSGWWVALLWLSGISWQVLKLVEDF